MSTFHKLSIKNYIQETANAVSLIFDIPEVLKNNFAFSIQHNSDIPKYQQLVNNINDAISTNFWNPQRDLDYNHGNGPSMLTYTFTGTTPGKYIFYVPVCAAGQVTGCPLVPLEITVLDPSTYTDKPVANNDVATIKYNSPTTINILANDKAGNPGSSLNPSSVSVAVQPAHGTVVVNADGTITYTPTSGYVGTDSVIYTICDNSTPAKCNEAVVYFTIHAASIPAVTIAVDDYNTITGSINITGTITANEFHTTYVTSSAMFTSGSTKFGNDGTDTHQFTGSVGILGSVTLPTVAGTVATGGENKILVTDNSGNIKYRTDLSLQGVTGTQGSTGTQGVQGVQGIIGSQGAIGTQGTTGAQGTNGEQGVQGTQGVQGETGIQGSTGAQGIQGIEGVQGQTGTQGAIGKQGPIGAQGI